jgi:hypothetical protein
MALEVYEKVYLYSMILLRVNLRVHVPVLVTLLYL